MSGEPHARTAQVQPVVLVGGQSTRFGRDKLLEPVRGKPLVQHPIDALRAVFGPRVMVVGACDQRVRALADGDLPDLHPGAGPIGGIVSALASTRWPVFVLAGDMPMFGRDEVHAVLSAQRPPDALAAWAWSGRAHPCAGVYEPASLDILRAALAAGRHALVNALPLDRVVRVPIHASRTLNVNTPADARAAGGQPAVRDGGARPW